MGNDGGSIPKRRELVKEAARAATTTQVKQIMSEQQGHLWSHCALSDEALRTPVVSDALGRLFNREAVIEYLLALERASADDAANGAAEILLAEQQRQVAGMIESLRDVVEVHFAVDKTASGTVAWVCPVTGKPLGPGTRAVYVVPCGHAFSETAVRNVQNTTDEQRTCLHCDAAYAPTDLIPILPTSEAEIARLAQRMATLQTQGLAHSLRKAHKSKSKKKRRRDDKEENEAGLENGDAATEKSAETALVANGLMPSGHKTKSSTHKHTPNGKINDVATAALTAGVLAEQQATQSKRQRKTAADSLFTSHHNQSKSATGKNTDFMTRGFSVSTAATK